MACNDSNTNPCRTCNQGITIPTCTKLCDFIVETDCVELSEDIECLNIQQGETLTSALGKICGQSGGDNCPCPVSTYTVNSMCGLRIGEIKELSSLEESVDPSCVGIYTIPLEDGGIEGTGADIQVTVDGLGTVTLEIVNPGINYNPGDSFTVDVGGCELNITVDSVIGIESDTDGGALLSFNVTPNFSQSTPTYIDVAHLIPDTDFVSPGYVFSSFFRQLIPTITEGVSFDFFASIVGLQPNADGDNKFYSFQLVDNLGNYSEIFTILDSEIKGCVPEPT